MALLIQTVQSSSAESAKGAVVEPKYTCARPSYRKQYPAIESQWEEHGFGWC